MGDPAMQLLGALISGIGPFQQAMGSISPEEEQIAAALGRARFEVYGTDVPPDATFSLRIADGVVSEYEYNGTFAPVVTTFYGLYDRHYSHVAGGTGDGEWDLPARWLDPPAPSVAGVRSSPRVPRAADWRSRTTGTAGSGSWPTRD